MRIIFIIFALMLAHSASYAQGSGFNYKNESLASKAVALALFEEMKLAEEDDRDVDVCYFGDWEQALENVSDPIYFAVLDIYAGGELDAQIYHSDGRSTYGIIRPCSY